MTDEKDERATGKLPPMKPKSAAAKPAYNVKAGFNFGCSEEKPDGTRVEPGALTVKLPPGLLEKLIARGAIEKEQE